MSSLLRIVPYLLILAVWIHAFVDCLGTPPHRVRRLPKGAWLAIILLLGPVLVGPLAWLALGRRPERAIGPGGVPMAWRPPYDGQGQQPGPYGPYDVLSGRPEPRPWGQDQPDGWVPPDDNPEFLRSLDERRRKGTQD